MRPSSAVRIASSKREPILNVRAKSRPVPRGTTASSGPTTPATPFTTSLTVPSPPTTTSSSYSCAACAASWVISPAAEETSTSPFRPSCAARCASSGQRRPVEPPADAGLTRKTVRALMTGGRGRERDPRHPVDPGLQLAVGDPREDALDGDVRHGERAARLRAAQRCDGEERRRLHLDREHAARRPALVLALVRVVEEVARHDRADVELLADLLRHVHGAVDQLPARRRAV